MDINEYMKQVLDRYSAKYPGLGEPAGYPAVTYDAVGREPGFFADNEVCSEIIRIKIGVWDKVAKSAWEIAEGIRREFSDDGWLADNMRRTSHEDSFSVELLMSNEMFV